MTTTSESRDLDTTVARHMVVDSSEKVLMAGEITEDDAAEIRHHLSALRGACSGLADEVDDLRARLAEAEDDRDRYRAALEWYADTQNWIREEVDLDFGHRARIALSGDDNADDD